MLDLTSYKKAFERIIAPFLIEKKEKKTTQRCLIQISAHEVAILHTNYTQETIEILFSDVFQYENVEGLSLILTSLVKKHTLEDIPTQWLLSAEEYQLFLIESLPVKKDEFSDAIKWRMRSLISYPVDEAIIDYFFLPPKKSSSENSMVAAVAAKSYFIKKMSNLLTEAEFNLKKISIPELALRNLTAAYETDEKSTAFIYFDYHHVLLNITSKKTLYFTRTIYLPTNNVLTQQDYEQLCLDILRYFDYFQSQWRLASPSRVFVASVKDNAENIAKELSTQLLVTVEPFLIKQILTSQLKTLQNKFLLLLGLALGHEENTYVATRN